MKQKKYFHQKSFTLIELLVVISIIGLLMSIIITAMRGVKGSADIARKLQISSSFHHLLGSYLVGEWNFNEGSGDAVADTSGNFNHAARYNNPGWVDSAASSLGKALDFTSGSYVRTNSESSSLNLSGGDVTVTVWVKFHVLSHMSGNLCIFSYLIGSPGQPSDYILYQSGDDGIHLIVGGNDILSEGELTIEKWYFIAGTWDNSKKVITIYIDGEKNKEESKNSAWTTVYESGYAYIGGGHNDSVYATIDEVRVYGTSLTSSQVKSLYAEGAVKRSVAVK